MEPKYQKEHVFQVLKYMCPRKLYRKFPIQQLKNQFPDLMDHRDVDAFSKAIYRYSGDLMSEYVGHPDVFVLGVEKYLQCAEMDDVEAMKSPATAFRVISDQGKRFMFAEDFENNMNIVGTKGETSKHETVDGFHRMISHQVYGEYLESSVTLKVQNLRYDDQGLPFPVKSPKFTWCMPAWFAIQKVFCFLRVEMNAISSLSYPDSAKQYLAALSILENWFPHENGEMSFVDYEKVEDMCDQLETLLAPFSENVKNKHSLDELKLMNSLQGYTIVPSASSIEDLMVSFDKDLTSVFIVRGLPKLRKYIITNDLWKMIFGDRWIFDKSELSRDICQNNGEPKDDDDEKKVVDVPTLKTKKTEKKVLSDDCFGCVRLKKKNDNYKQSAIDSDKAIAKLRKVQETLKEQLEEAQKRNTEVNESVDQKQLIEGLQMLQEESAEALNLQVLKAKAEKEENVILVEKVNRLEKIIDDMKKEKEALETRIIKNEKETSVLLKDKNRTIGELEMKNEGLKEEIMLKKRAAKLLDKKVTDDMLKMEKLEKNDSKLQNYKNENKKLIASNNKLKKTNKSLNDRLSIMTQDEKNSCTSSKKSETDKLKKTLEVKDVELRDIVNKCERLTTTVTTMKTECEQWRKKYETASEVVEIYSKSFQAKLKELRMLSDALIEVKTTTNESYKNFLDSRPSAETFEVALKQLLEFQSKCVNLEYVLLMNITKMEENDLTLLCDLLPIPSLPVHVDFSK